MKPGRLEVSVVTANAVLFGLAVSAYLLYVRAINYNNGELYTVKGSADVIYISKVFMFFSLFPALIMLLIQAFVYTIWKALELMSSSPHFERLLRLWVAYLLCAPILYFGLTMRLPRSLDPSGSEVLDGLLHFIGWATPIILAILFMELVVCTAVRRIR